MEQQPKHSRKDYLTLFTSTFTLSAFTFGGGFVIIPLMRKKFVEQLHWIDEEEMMDLTAAYCRRLGLEPYYLYRQKNMAGNFENVGYAAPGKACIYNILIMEEKQTIVACGAGTTTKVTFPAENRLERAENVKDVASYIERIDEMIDRKEKLLSKLV